MADQMPNRGTPGARRLEVVPDRPDDAEVVIIEHGELGKFVDPPVERPGALRRLLATVEGNRAPILPGWLFNARARKETAKQATFALGYWALLHLRWSPVYAFRLLLWTPRGILRFLGIVVQWASAEEGNWSLRQAAARKGDGDTWMALDARRSKQARVRIPWAVAGLVVLTGIGAAVYFFAPWWVQSPLAAAAVLFFGRLGKPIEKALFERVTPGRRFTRLTAEMVRGAVCAVGVPRLDDPARLMFPQEIHRDGPGWLARVNLPPGVEAVQVLERRGKLSSALQLPVDQVWPTAGPDHAGQLDLWVGYQPASKMGQPPWSLASPTARTSVFEEFDFASDQRQRPVKTALFARNFLIGGVPGSGKSYGARTLALGAALDPTVELMIAEFKGTADFGDLAPLCSRYVCGVDDAALEAGAGMVEWLLAEAERRGTRIRKAREKGLAPEGKVTPELAAKPNSNLHPIVLIIDEAHELLADKEVAKNLERLIKRGRALALIVILATQVADRDSVPPIITRCVTIRWAMAVPDQIANDQLLGTGAYKRGVTATSYRPGIDAGWGVLTGLAEPTSARSQYPDQDTTTRIIARATVLRGGAVVGGRDERTPRRDIVADIRACVRPGEGGAHWEMLAERLPQIDDSYEGWTAEVVSVQARARKVPSKDVKIAGVNKKGARLPDLLAVLGGGSDDA